MTEVAAPLDSYDLDCETLIIGAGACGLVAALAAKDAGQEVLVIEADKVPSGSTALSAGLIPAAGTALQKSAGITGDTADAFARDIQAKAKGENRSELVDALARGAAPAIDWLVTRYGLPFSVVTDFDYPGHSHRRMHGLPSRSGAELINALRSACEAEQIDIICERRAHKIFANDLRVFGVAVQRNDGGEETLGCQKLILACNGFGGNREMVATHMPDIEDAVWFGHDGNKGEAVSWADALGAQTEHLGAYQGHGNVAHPHGILITWATMTEGGLQVNLTGERFWNEAQGYSEAARAVMRQPDGVAFAIFDARIAAIARQFQDFKDAESVGAVQSAQTPEDLAQMIGVPAEALARTLAEFGAMAHTGTGGQDGDGAPGIDKFGRSVDRPELQAPYCAVRVTGALFHTQGGLKTDGQGRVAHVSGKGFENLFAGGGAACGVSGRGDSGYLSGNGLLAAVVLGRAAGLAADVS